MAASPILLRRSRLAMNSLMQSDLALTLLSFARSVRFRMFSNRKNHVSTRRRLENTATFSLKWRLKDFAWNLVPGCRKFLAGIGIRFLTTLRVGVGFFVRLRMSSWIMFYITRLNWEGLLKWYNFFETFVEAEISCCVPRFPLLLTAKFHSLCVKESESEISERLKSESEILGTRSRIFYLRLRNPVCYSEFIYTYWTNKPEYLMFVFFNLICTVHFEENLEENSVLSWHNPFWVKWLISVIITPSLNFSRLHVSCNRLHDVDFPMWPLPEYKADFVRDISCNSVEKTTNFDSKAKCLTQDDYSNIKIFWVIHITFEISVKLSSQPTVKKYASNLDETLNLFVRQVFHPRVAVK